MILDIAYLVSSPSGIPYTVPVRNFYCQKVGRHLWVLCFWNLCSTSVKNSDLNQYFCCYSDHFWCGGLWGFFVCLFQIPGAPDDEAVRIFLEFERVESAIKGRVLNCVL